MNDIIPIEISRKKIDEIDSEIVRLFNERMKISGDVARYKKANGLPVYSPEREKELLEKIRALSENDFSGYTEKLYSEILTVSKDYQKKICG